MKDDKLDAMVAAASLPNLASLFKKAKESGLVSETQGYK
nr:MAG TPA_asm: hypothetical protein [Caudoviricetes sp.]